MATRQIRYLVGRKGAGGTTRWFWQPSPSLFKQGFRTIRLAPNDTTPWKQDPPGYVCDAADLWSKRLDAWRDGSGPHPFDDEKPLAEANGDVTRPRKSLRPGTIDALITRYKAHRAFLKLADSTQKMYKGNLDIISEWAGDLHVLELDVDMALEFYDEMYPVTPTKANHVMSILRALYSFARRRGKTERVPFNPFKELDLEWTRKAPRIWSPEEVDLFVAHADSLGRFSVGTAVMLNEWIGQRGGDVLKLSRNVYRDGDLRFTQSKTKREVYLPIHLVQKLTTRLEQETARWEHRGVVPTTLIASEATGHAYSDNAFSHVFRDVRASLALQHPETIKLWFMRLRHTAVVRLGEAGVTVPQIAAITGHTLKTCYEILERYNVRTDKMAVSAFQQRIEAEA